MIQHDSEKPQDTPLVIAMNQFAAASGGRQSLFASFEFAD
jgi:hypothetical protein